MPPVLCGASAEFAEVSAAETEGGRAAVEPAHAEPLLDALCRTACVALRTPSPR